jgi:hypothetical protein
MSTLAQAICVTTHACIARASFPFPTPFASPTKRKGTKLFSFILLLDRDAISQLNMALENEAVISSGLALPHLISIK